MDKQKHDRSISQGAFNDRRVGLNTPFFPLHYILFVTLHPV